jgi:hypothetical protein
MESGRTVRRRRMRLAQRSFDFTQGKMVLFYLEGS